MNGKCAATRATRALLAVPVALALLLGGCTPPEEEPPPTTSPPQTTAPASPSEPGSPSPSAPGSAPPSSPEEGSAMVDASLRIELTSAGSDAMQERTLECADSQPLESSTVREPEAACEALANAGEKVFFGLPDPNVICTQEYGGPQQAHVTGTLNGQPVDKHFSLTDGCKISEWNAMKALLGGIGGAV